MLQEIGATIVSFLVGAAATYFLGKWSKIFTKIDCLEMGVQAILRDRMTQMHKYYLEKKKPIPQMELESFEGMYSAYKNLNGNHYIDDVRHDILEVMPHEPR